MLFILIINLLLILLITVVVFGLHRVILILWSTPTICILVAVLNLTYKPTNKNYLVVGVYCPTKANDKDTFWNFLHNLVFT